MLSDDMRKWVVGLTLGLIGLALGVLLVAAEFVNIPAGQTQPSILGVKVTGQAWAERVFMILFGLIHVLVAVVITIFRRTAP